MTLLLGASLALGRALELLLSPTTELVNLVLFTSPGVPGGHHALTCLGIWSLKGCHTSTCSGIRQSQGSQEVVTPRPAQGPNSWEAVMPRPARGFDL